MGEDLNVNLGRWDGVIAKRMLRRGPVEVYHMLNDNSLLFSVIVRFKWEMLPDVRLARELNRILASVKQMEPNKYQEFRQQILNTVKSGLHGDEDKYKRYVKLIDNPDVDKNFDEFVIELIENSPKTREVFWKLSARDDELKRFNLDYRIDYIVNDSKKIDLLLVKLVFFMAFWHGNAELILRYIRTCIKMRNDKARLAVARILWPDVPRLVNLYERNYKVQQELYDFTKQAYQTTVDDTKQFYNESVKEIEKKHNSIERYKELIRTGQLQPFKKK